MARAAVVYHDDLKLALLYHPNSGATFGPVFTGPWAKRDAEDFLDWLEGPGADYADRKGIRHRDGNARTFTPDGLALMRERWENERVAEGEHQDEAKARNF